MSASFRQPSSAAHPRVWLVGWVLGSACLPSNPLHDYARDNAGGAAGTSSGGGAAGMAGSGGSGAAGVGGQSGAGAGPDADAGAPDGGGATPEDAGTSLTLDAALPAALCAADERLGPDDRCYFFDASLASWAAARTACQARGAAWDLVVVRSAALSVFLGDELTFEAWLGATDAASEGQWLWVGDLFPFWTGNGTTGGASGGAYTNWNPTEPNGGTATNCARALPRSLGSANPNAPWADLDCATPLGAVCESGPPP